VRFMAHLKAYWRSGSAFPRHPAAEAKILEPDLYANVSGSREGEFPDLETQLEWQVWKHPEAIHFDDISFHLLSCSGGGGGCNLTR